MENTQENTQEQNTQPDPLVNLKGEMNRKLAKLTEDNATLRGLLEAIVEKDADGNVKLKASTPEKKETVPDWQTEVNALKAELKRRDDLIQEKDKKAALESKRSALIDALSKGNAVNPQRDAVHIMDQVVTNSEGKFVVYGKDANGLEIETDVNTFVKEWLKSNPELVKASGKPGSGTPATHAGTNQDVASLANMSTADYFAMMKKKK